MSLQKSTNVLYLSKLHIPNINKGTIGHTGRSMRVVQEDLCVWFINDIKAFSKVKPAEMIKMLQLVGNTSE